MNIFIVELNDFTKLAAQLSTITADIQTLKAIMTQATEDLLREVRETKEQNTVVVAAIGQLVGVVTPLMAAVASANAALAAAQAELAAMQSANADLDAQLAAAATDLDAAQAGVQTALDAMPAPPAEPGA
jgi:chromosome segregation ATPase